MVYKKIKAIIVVILLAGLLMLSVSCSILSSKEESQTAAVIVEDKQVEETVPIIELPYRFVFPGDYLAIHVKELMPEDKIYVSTTLANKNPVFYTYAGGRYTLIGIDYRVKKGDYPLKVQILRGIKIVAEIKTEIGILNKEFEKQYLKVSAEQVSLRADDKYAEDLIHTEIARRESSEKPLWEGKFIMPNEGRISTEFGVIRYINGVESGRHSGIDVAVPKGTPIKASNSGVVKLSKMLNVTGNTVIIDHGFNINSAYAHLEKIYVKEGQEVKKGEVIGEVGSTGFSTGPHLHWTISIASTYISPYLLLEKDPLELLY